MFDLFLVLCMAMLGGAFGSFLNVVIWRLPEKMSLVSPPSHCPKCGHVIRFYDNVPIAGWILLRGKCRDCHAPISGRYPFVETVCFVIAGLFSWLILCAGWTPEESSLLYWNAMANWIQESANLTETPLPYFSDEFISNYETLVQKGCLLSVLWSALLFLLLTAGLIEYDGKQVPKSLLLFMLCFGCLVFFLGGFLFVTERALKEITTFQEQPELKLSFFTGLFLLLIITRGDVFKILTLTFLLIPFFGAICPLVVIYAITVLVLFVQKIRKKNLTPTLALFGAVPVYLIFHKLFLG